VKEYLVEFTVDGVLYKSEMTDKETAIAVVLELLGRGILSTKMYKPNAKINHYVQVKP
jgi:hypothetical protein